MGWDHLQLPNESICAGADRLPPHVRPLPGFGGLPYPNVYMGNAAEQDGGGIEVHRGPRNDGGIRDV